MEVVKELLEGGADPNQADEVRTRLALAELSYLLSGKCTFCGLHMSCFEHVCEQSLSLEVTLYQDGECMLIFEPLKSLLFKNKSSKAANALPWYSRAVCMIDHY